MSYVADLGSGNQAPHRSAPTQPRTYIQTRTRESRTDDDDPVPYYQASPYQTQSTSRSRSYSREHDAYYVQGVSTSIDPYYQEPPVQVYYSSVDPPADFKLAPTDPDGFRVLLLNECLQFLAGRERDFAGFRSWASFLEKVVRLHLFISFIPPSALT
jgi:hypothetical protein